MTVPSPIPSNVFVDGELTNEASWYGRIFTKINDLIALAAENQVDTGIVGSAISPAAGNTITRQSLHKYGRLVMLDVSVTVASIGAGNIANLLIASITDSQFFPEMTASISTSDNGIGMEGFVYNTGNIYIASTDLAATSTNYGVSFGGCWISAT